MQHDAHVGVPLQLGQDRPGAVGAAVVDDDHLQRQAAAADPADDLGDGLPLVEDGDDDRQQKVVGQGINAQPPAGCLAQQPLEQPGTLGRDDWLRHTGEQIRNAVRTIAGFDL